MYVRNTAYSVGCVKKATEDDSKADVKAKDAVRSWASTKHSNSLLGKDVTIQYVRT